MSLRHFNYLLLITISVLLSSCFKGQKVDLIIHNGSIHTLNETNDSYEAMAIKDGKIVELGAERQILNKYHSEKEIDAGKRDIYPALTDVTVDLFEGINQQLSLNLTNTYSFEELIVRIEKHIQKTKENFIIGFHLDTLLWPNSKFSSSKLNERFNNIELYLHFERDRTIFLNQKAIGNSKINTKNGFIINNGTINYPTYSNIKKREAFKDLAHTFLQYGILGIFTNIRDESQLQLFKNTKLTITSFTEYNSKQNFTSKTKKITFDFKHIMNSKEQQLFIETCVNHKYQVFFKPNNEDQLKQSILFCKEVNEVIKDHRWMIQYNQEISPDLLNQLEQTEAFLILAPTSIQTNKSYYPYRKTIKKNGLYAIGSNFPMNHLYPYEVINNVTSSSNPQSLSIEETIKGYCFWPSYLLFQEEKNSTLTKGKDATFVIFEHRVKTSEQNQANYARLLFKKGIEVYNAE